MNVSLLQQPLATKITLPLRQLYQVTKIQELVEQGSTIFDQVHAYFAPPCSLNVLQLIYSEVLIRHLACFNPMLFGLDNGFFLSIVSKQSK